MNRNLAIKLVGILLLSLSIYSIHKDHRVKVHEKLKVAIVDTGLDLEDPRFKNLLCENGHKNFVPNETIEDRIGHGTHVAGLIKEYAGLGNYCFLIYKYFLNTETGNGNFYREIASFEEAIKNGAIVINFSAGGNSFDPKEFWTIANNKDVTFVVAAGNEGLNLDNTINAYFPASYFLPNEFVVENVDNSDVLSKSSNYSTRAVKEHGVNVMSTLPCKMVNNKNYCYGYMSGTSMATAIFSGKLVAKLLKM